jgi:F-box and leucine-rich repeat protein 2/20
MSCTNLRSICVSKCGSISDATLLALAANNPQLRTLEVAGCNSLTDAGFQALGKV